MRRVLAVLMGAPLILAACSQAPAPASTPTAGAAAAGASAAPAASPAARPAASPAAAGSPGAVASAVSIGNISNPSSTAKPSGPQEISVNALQGEPDNIDPSRSSFNTEAAVIRQVFEPLLRLDPNLKPVPAAASSYDVSPDGKTYTFHLRQGAKWSDGKPVTAQDFVYSFDRILDPSTAAEYSSFFVSAGITGAAAFNKGTNKDPNSVGVKALDANTLQITLDAPAGYFPDLVTLWVVPPLRKDIIDAHPKDWTQNPATYIGNGPFKMSEWAHQDHITLVPNPNYVGPNKPILTKLTYLMVTNNEADYAAFRNGERAWTLVPDADVKAVKADPTLSKESIEYTELTTFWLALNNTHKPLDNPLVRQAFSRAIDRNALIRDIANGVGKPAVSIIPPGMPGYQADLGSNVGFDPTAAKQLLAQAGYSDPSKFPSLTFSYATNSANQTRAEFVQQQLKQNLGISIKLQSMDPKAFQAAYKAKNYDIGFTGWGADYPDPQDWMTGLFGCKASNNKYNYCDQAFDQAAAKGDSSTDPNTRLQAYAQAQSTLIKDLPVIPLFYRGRLVVHQPWVHDLTITGQDDYPGDFFLNRVFVTQH